jgi:hypothetical protein
VPDEGALGERVAQSGGGWRLPAPIEAADAARLVCRLLLTEDGIRERLRIQSALQPDDPWLIPSLEAMQRELDTLYARYASSQCADDDADGLSHLLAANLDGFVFRQELVRLTGELANAQRAIAGHERFIEQLNRDIAGCKAWASKLEADVAHLNASLAERDAQCAAQRAELDRLRRGGGVLTALPALIRRVLQRWRRRRAA